MLAALLALFRQFRFDLSQMCLNNPQPGLHSFVGFAASGGGSAKCWPLAAPMRQRWLPRLPNAQRVLVVRNDSIGDYLLGPGCAA